MLIAVYKYNNLTIRRSYAPDLGGGGVPYPYMDI